VAGEVWWLVGLAAVLLFIVVPGFQFNRMVTLRNRVHESWSNVDTELKRRYDLIPNLVESVKGYAKHEKDVVAAVSAARARAIASAGRPSTQAADENALVRAVNRLFAVAEAYPQLRASENFLQLQNELSNTEDRIQAARRFYNGNVRDYLNQTRQFPGVLLARMFGMGPEDYFEIDSVAMRQAPRVDLRARA
jgi:LemA protein